MVEPVASFVDVTKAYQNVVALNRLSLEIGKGSIFGFIGPNGAGKSTALRILMGIVRPTSGHVTVLGSRDPHAVRNRFSFLPEERGVYDNTRVEDFAVYFGRLRGLGKVAARNHAEELLRKFDLFDVKREKCGKLSKGMTQKLQILTTFLHDPDLLVLDEPYSGLDPINLEIVRELILDTRSQGKTVILSTHIMEIAEQSCDELVLLDKGQSVLSGSLSDIRSQSEMTLKIQHESTDFDFAQLPGVNRVNRAGNQTELSLAGNMDTQELLRQLINSIRVSGFERSEPSLHEIFIRAVGSTTLRSTDD